MNFTLDQLLALDAIVRTGTFAGAASELHKVPSAISYLVQGLETALGVPAFDRTRRKAVLTKEGQRLLEASRDVIERARALERVAMELAGGWEAELHVVVDGALPMAPITACLRRFALPDVPTSLRLDVEYQEGVLDQYDAQNADVALYLGFDSEADRAGYHCTALTSLEFVLVASPDHDLAIHGYDEGRRAQHAELVVRDSSPRFAMTAKASFMGSRHVVHLSDFYTKRVALMDAAGYGWVPRHLVQDDLEAGRLVLLDAEMNEWTYQPQVVRRAGEAAGRGVSLFLEILGSEYGVELGV